MTRCRRSPRHRLHRRGRLAKARSLRASARLAIQGRRASFKHLEHIYDKLGVRTRAAAAVALAGRAVPWSALAADFGDTAQWPVDRWSEIVVAQCDQSCQT